MKFIHLTDTHLGCSGQKIYGRNPRPPLDRAIMDINRQFADADFCIITGDLTHLGQPEAFSELKDCLSNLQIHYYLVIGNHDCRDTLRSVFPELPSDENGFIQYDVDAGTHRLIILDTVRAGSHSGELCQQRLHWLDTELSRSDKPVFLFMHHAPFSIGMPALDTIGFTEENRQQLLTLLNRYNTVEHIFFGHCHRPISGHWKGISFSTLKGMNHQSGLNLSNIDIEITFESPVYNVVLADADSVVVHTREFTYEDECFLEREFRA